MVVDVKKGDGVVESGLVLGEAIGAVVIGEASPVGMSKEVFSDSSDLLFHGAGEEFEWRRDFDYAHKDANQHSQKAGRGFYATPSRADAVLFSEAFGAGETPVVLKMLPHEARVFDFRVEDYDKNANVPESLLEKYVDYYKRLYEEKWGEYSDVEDREFVDTHADEVDMPDEERRANATSFEDMFATIPSPHSEERAMRLNRIVHHGEAGFYLQMLESHKNKGVDLREMLSLDGNASNSEYASEMFPNFMLEQGYDGIIYIEGGDHPEHVAPVSYVFYNLDKIGTHEAWNTEEKSVNSARERFRDVLRGIQEHMFVTDDTAVYREEMRRWVDEVKDESDVGDLVFFPTGSVAVGMVSIEANSDIDGVVAYSCDENEISQVSDVVQEAGLPEEFNPFLVSSRVEDRIREFFERTDMLSESSRSYLTDSVALLFVPSLSELQNGDEQALVEGWRQQVITELGKLPDGKGEVVWNLMRDWLEGQYVHYENSDGGDAEKRQRRVDMVMDKKIRERFVGSGESEKRVERAKSLIESMRANFHYPSFQEMQMAYSDEQD